MAPTLMIKKRTHDLGGGFIVGRVLPAKQQRMVGPFIFFDHMGPLTLAPGVPRELDVRPHPHIGLSTLTYLYQGAMTHRDSLGFTQEVRPGEVNWMTSGRGVTHSERLEYARSHGAEMHGIQAWVALPKENEEDDPSFHHYEGQDQLPEWQEDGVKSRLIAGQTQGMSSAVNTHSPLFYMHWIMEPGATGHLGTEYNERAIYVAKGQIEIDGHRLDAGQMLILEANKATRIQALEETILMLLGGEPIGERYLYWNFVSSSKERIEQAKADWQAQRMPMPIDDADEFIPLP